MIHGSKGKGRFAFINFANLCRWETTYSNNSRKQKYSINISSDNKDRYDVSEEKNTDESTGTSVIIENIFNLSLESINSSQFKSFLMNEFSWFLHLNKDKGYNIFINDERLPYEELIDSSLSQEKL